MSTIVSRIFLFFCVMLLAAIALAWSRSPRFTDSIELVSPRGGMLISSHPGRLCACWPSPLVHPVGMRRWTVTAASTPRDEPPLALDMEGNSVVYDVAFDGIDTIGYSGY